MLRGARGTTLCVSRGIRLGPGCCGLGKEAFPLGILSVPLRGPVGTFSQNTALFPMMNGWSGVS